MFHHVNNENAAAHLRASGEFAKRARRIHEVMEEEHRDDSVELSITRGECVNVAATELDRPLTLDPPTSRIEHRGLPIDRNDSSYGRCEPLRDLPSSAPDISHNPLWIDEREQPLDTARLSEQFSPNRIPLASDATEELD
jgi:hypothetical protein